MNSSSTASQRAMFVFICFVWGTTWLAMKVGIATVSPGIFAGLRWTIAGAIILAFRRARGQRVMPPPRLIPRLIFVSVILITLNQVIQLYGLKYITAGLAAVISSALTPIALLVFAVVAGQERFTARQLGAIGVGVVGVLTLFGPAAIAGTLDVWQVIGASLVTIGVVCYTAGSVMTRPMMRTLEPVQLAGLTDLIGGVVLLVSSLAIEPGSWESMHLHWGWPAFLGWLYLLVPGALMSTTMYFLLVRDWGASRPGTYAFISPVIAVVIGCSFFGENLDWGDAIGMILMLGAAGLALRPAGASRVTPISTPPRLTRGTSLTI
ncbi:DMT family transporter [Acidisphaera sp. S103]|uniref:DMT family transporter n=1 Tax=Acidisphaera sp. S103 TaxID=1747223 RepID=UPI001C20C0E4|nr:EamA family transporter [Acidisphaera sp. S103]